MGPGGGVEFVENCEMGKGGEVEGGVEDQTLMALDGHGDSVFDDDDEDEDEIQLVRRLLLRRT